MVAESCGKHLTRFRLGQRRRWPSLAHRCQKFHRITDQAEEANHSQTCDDGSGRGGQAIEKKLGQPGDRIEAKNLRAL